MVSLTGGGNWSTWKKPLNLWQVTEEPYTVSCELKETPFLKQQALNNNPEESACLLPLRHILPYNMDYTILLL